MAESTYNVCRMEMSSVLSITITAKTLQRACFSFARCKDIICSGFSFFIKDSFITSEIRAHALDNLGFLVTSQLEL